MNTPIVDLTKKLGNTGCELRPALCLNLDGTVRRSKADPKGFIKDLDDMELMPGIEAKIKEYKAAGFLVFGITNQGGGAHGYKTAEDVYKEISHMAGLFEGGDNPFDLVVGAHSWEKGTVEPYCHRSLLRKPDIGMLAFCELKMFDQGIVVDWDNSLFVGDRDDDRECAKRAAIRFLHIDEFLAPVVPVQKALPETLDEAVDYLLPKFKDAKTWPEFEQGEDTFAVMCHSVTMGGIGMQIRNELKLWQPETPLHQFFLTHHNLFHPDDMSDRIIRAIYQKLKTQPVSLT